MENEINILRKLVSYNTCKDKENKEIINYIESYLKNLGFITKYKSRCLIMQKGKNPKVGFLGHTDTVTPNLNNWKTNPFELKEKDNKLYGLGTCDMKGGIAGILKAVSNINIDENSGVKLYFTYDEEIGFGGINELINNNEEFPENMIIGEPTDNVLVNGSKGLIEYNLEFKRKKSSF